MYLAQRCLPLSAVQARPVPSHRAARNQSASLPFPASSDPCIRDLEHDVGNLVEVGRVVHRSTTALPRFLQLSVILGVGSLQRLESHAQ